MKKILTKVVTLTATEKLDIIGNEYDIPIEEKFREEVDIMCNLSQSVKEKGIAIGLLLRNI